jgi:hypothetical protein
MAERRGNHDVHGAHVWIMSPVVAQRQQMMAE